MFLKNCSLKKENYDYLEPEQKCFQNNFTIFLDIAQCLINEFYSFQK